MTDQIFRIEVFVRSKNLGDVLAMLTGRAASVSLPQLVTNAAMNSRGKMRSIISRQQAIGLFALYVKDQNLQYVSPNEVRKFLGTIGASPNSYAYYLTRAKEAGMLRKTGEGTASKWKANPAKVAALAKEGEEVRKQMEMSDGEAQ